jgi:hypothetical protein
MTESARKKRRPRRTRISFAAGPGTAVARAMVARAHGLPTIAGVKRRPALPRTSGASIVARLTKKQHARAQRVLREVLSKRQKARLARAAAAGDNTIPLRGMMLRNYRRAGRGLWLLREALS